MRIGLGVEEACISAGVATRWPISGHSRILAIIAQRQLIGIDPRHPLLGVEVHRDPAHIGAQVGPLHAKDILPAIVAKAGRKQRLSEKELHLGTGHALPDLIELFAGQVVALLDVGPVGREDAREAAAIAFGRRAGLRCVTAAGAFPKGTDIASQRCHARA